MIPQARIKTCPVVVNGVRNAKAGIVIAAWLAGSACPGSPEPAKMTFPVWRFQLHLATRLNYISLPRNSALLLASRYSQCTTSYYSEIVTRRPHYHPAPLPTQSDFTMASRASKIFFASSMAFMGAAVYGVHWLQKRESDVSRALVWGGGHVQL